MPTKTGRAVRFIYSILLLSCTPGCKHNCCSDRPVIICYFLCLLSAQWSFARRPINERVHRALLVLPIPLPTLRRNVRLFLLSFNYLFPLVLISSSGSASVYLVLILTNLLLFLVLHRPRCFLADGLFPLWLMATHMQFRPGRIPSAWTPTCPNWTRRQKFFNVSRKEIIPPKTNTRCVRIIRASARRPDRQY